MRRIDKSAASIVSTKFKAWVDKYDAEGREHDSNNRDYYDDVVMNLYRCQGGVCAYTEMWICLPQLYDIARWVDGRYRLAEDAGGKRNDHMGQLDHFDPADKKARHWNWDNLFMVHAKVNEQKSGNPVVSYLKPDHAEYQPEVYLEYDKETHLFVPNADIEDEQIRAEIQRMIDDVLRLNHGVILRERENYINEIKDKIKRGQPYEVYKFFTAVAWSINDL